jgi:hypothetical protein
MGANLADRLRDWHDFYMLIGTASATLIGLLFVAASIGTRYFTAEREAGLKAFLTPTVLHFTAVLTTCLVGTAPLHTQVTLGLLLVAIGLAGMGYAIRLWLTMNRGGITPHIDLADRTWYVFAPLFVYLMTVSTGLVLQWDVPAALALLAANLTLLLLVGIRNAWDMTVWVVIRTE